MMKTTTDHDEIRRWVEENNGNPQKIDHPEAEGDKVGLRINFPGSRDEAFLSEDTVPVDISWEEFFREFDEQDLAFEYDPDSKEDDKSYAFRFVRNSEF